MPLIKPLKHIYLGLHTLKHSDINITYCKLHICNAKECMTPYDIACMSCLLWLWLISGVEASKVCLTMSREGTRGRAVMIMALLVVLVEYSQHSITAFTVYSLKARHDKGAKKVW